MQGARFVILHLYFMFCFYFNWQVTPYHNMTLHGVVHKTILRGNVVYERDRVCDIPAGQLILEKPSRGDSLIK